MTAQRIVLLHNPLIGPASLRALAAELAGRGAQVELPAWPKLGDVEGAYYPALARDMAAAIEAGGATPVVLVAHGSAGALVPALAAEPRVALAGVILMDAVLPHPGRSWMDTAPAETREALRAGAAMGQLPPWDNWWPPGALEKLLPDPATREALLAELEPLPLAYFEEAAPQAGLAELTAPCACLQLSDGYADEMRAATRLGWPGIILRLTHLAPLSHPIPVAAALLSLAARLAERANA
jgi:hypothetical protein